MKLYSSNRLPCIPCMFCTACFDTIISQQPITPYRWSRMEFNGISKNLNSVMEAANRIFTLITAGSAVYTGDSKRHIRIVVLQSLYQCINKLINMNCCTYCLTEM